MKASAWNGLSVPSSSDWSSVRIQPVDADSHPRRFVPLVSTGELERRATSRVRARQVALYADRRSTDAARVAGRRNRESDALASGSGAAHESTHPGWMRYAAGATDTPSMPY